MSQSLLWFFGTNVNAFHAGMTTNSNRDLARSMIKLSYVAAKYAGVVFCGTSFLGIVVPKMVAATLRRHVGTVVAPSFLRYVRGYLLIIAGTVMGVALVPIIYSTYQRYQSWWMWRRRAHEAIDRYRTDHGFGDAVEDVNFSRLPFVPVGTRNRLRSKVITEYAVMLNSKFGTQPRSADQDLVRRKQVRDWIDEASKKAKLARERDPGETKQFLRFRDQNHVIMASVIMSYVPGLTEVEYTIISGTDVYKDAVAMDDASAHEGRRAP